MIKKEENWFFSTKIANDGLHASKELDDWTSAMDIFTSL
jgi:hypothetical protein